MFWIGIIVGIIVGIVVGIVGLVLFSKKMTNMTFDEMSECGILLMEAGDNRESTIEWHNATYDEFGTVILPEK